MLEIWVGFVVGMVVRAADRAQHVVAQKPDRTWAGYLRHNRGRLLIRLGSSLALFYYFILPMGWVVAPPMAFLVGLSFDTMLDSLLDRAKQRGELLLNKHKNGGEAT